MNSDIDIGRGLTSLEAVLRNNDAAAASVLADMSPEALHELMRACLVTANLARASILGPASYSSDPSGVRTAHQVAEALSYPEVSDS